MLSDINLQSLHRQEILLPHQKSLDQHTFCFSVVAVVEMAAAAVVADTWKNSILRLLQAGLTQL